MDPARLRRRVLTAVTSVGEQEACVLLDVSTTGSDDGLSCIGNHGKMLRFEVDGRPRYPLFQFDVEHHRVVPGLSAILVAKPPGWSDYRLLHWLTTPHADFGRTPAEAIASDSDAVLAAFQREVDPPCHG